MSIENNLKRIADSLETLVHKFDHIGQAVDQVKVDETAKVSPAPKQQPTVSVAESAAVGNSMQVTTAPAAEVPPPPPAEQVTPAPTIAPPVNTPVAAPPVNTPVAAAQVQIPPAAMTPEELNKALVAEFQRLGSREPIDAVMRAAPFNAQSITDLSAEQYTPLIAAVQAVKKEA